MTPADDGSAAVRQDDHEAAIEARLAERAAGGCREAALELGRDAEQEQRRHPMNTNEHTPAIAELIDAAKDALDTFKIAEATICDKGQFSIERKRLRDALAAVAAEAPERIAFDRRRPDGPARSRKTINLLASRLGRAAMDEPGVQDLVTGLLADLTAAARSTRGELTAFDLEGIGRAMAGEMDDAELAGMVSDTLQLAAARSLHRHADADGEPCSLCGTDGGAAPCRFGQRGLEHEWDSRAAKDGGQRWTKKPRTPRAGEPGFEMTGAARIPGTVR